jgi:CBS domain-containing protein
MQKASDIMTKNVLTVEASLSVAQAVQLMKEKQFRDLMVSPSKDGDSYGIVTETDVVYKVAALGKDPDAVGVAEIMTKPCLELDPDMSVQEVAQMFANHHIHRAPVITDELLGVVTIFDIVRNSMWWQD